METKPLLYGIIGFLLGGMIVSIAAVTIEKPKTTADSTTMNMVDSLRDKSGDDFDKAYVSGMIEHHQEAIDMSKLGIKQAGHKEIKDLSKTIIKAQQKEIDEMQQWQQDWGYSTNHMTHN